MRNLYVPILGVAAEGWLLIALCASVAGYFAVQGNTLAAVLIALPLPVLAAFFHDARRQCVARPLGVLAPVDGVVVFRRECHDAHLGREAIRIRIRIHAFGNYLLRAPVEGEVLALGDGVSRLHSRVQTDEHEDVVLAVVRGSLLGARPIGVPFGERVGQGRRCGLRRLVRELDVLIPAHARVEVTLGETVRCGETVLATLLRKH